MITEEMKQELINTAVQARGKAYAPYSDYKVGAALLSKQGKCYSGVNIENAVYPLTICAERVAVFKAVFDGDVEFEAIAVVTSNGGSPCGSCRQVLAEFGLDTQVLIANVQGQLIKEMRVGDLLPEAFGRQDLPD
jgi:cytidine deaminase